MTEPIYLGLSREYLHDSASKITETDRNLMRDWLETRPVVVQETAKDFDIFKIYRVKEGTTHAITGPGTVGVVEGFTEGGELVFVAHIVQPHESCDPEKIARTKELDGPIKVHLRAEVLEIDPEP